mmetsp:Transcript_44081/g.92708  ORF Transcript_44081/g.92708 Transcript_44081/m.92708 type:complete len:304 (+) Transcript_44081:876-1787(+)
MSEGMFDANRRSRDLICFSLWLMVALFPLAGLSLTLLWALLGAFKLVGPLPVLTDLEMVPVGAEDGGMPPCALAVLMAGGGTAGGAFSELLGEPTPPVLPSSGESTSTTNFHRGHGHINFKSVIIRPTSLSSLGRSYLLYKTMTTLPTLGESIGSPTAVLTPNWMAPPRRSNCDAGASETYCSHVGIPDWKIRPGRPHPEEKENFSLYWPKRERLALVSGETGRRRRLEAPGEDAPDDALPEVPLADDSSTSCTPMVTLPPKQRRKLPLFGEAFFSGAPFGESVARFLGEDDPEPSVATLSST